MDAPRRFRKISTSTKRPSYWRRNVLDADTKWLVWAESRFASVAGKNTDIDRETFKNALEVRNVFFADRFFDLFDIDHSSTVSQEEMMDGLFLLTKGTKEEKLRFFFDVCDMDENGSIDKNELRFLLKMGMEESSVQLSDQKLDHLTDTLFITADQNRDSTISFEEFIVTLKRYPDLTENLTISAGAWLKDTKRNKTRCCASRLRLSYLRNNIQRIVFMLCFFVVNCALFAEAAYRHSFNPDANWCFLIARGCGQALNFNCAVIVLVLLRKELSFLRSTWLMHLLPFDDTIRIHKTIGYLAALLSLTHTLGHIGNALILQTYKDFTAIQLLFTNTSILRVGLPVGKLAGSAFITGWMLDVVFLILIIGSLSFVRRSGHFQIFYWTHKICYYVLWFLLILHGPRFWCWFLGPAILFILEKISDMKIVRNIRFGKTYVKEANLLPSGVTHLVLTKPPNFKYKAGDYIFIQIPQLAKHEWHPFTISSAPEQTGIVSLHIRSAGNWTKRLYNFFDEMQPITRRKSVKNRSSSSFRQRVFGSGSAPDKTQLQGGEKVNKGFEMMEEHNGKDKPQTGGERDGNESRQVDEMAVTITPNGSYVGPDDDVFDEPPPVLTVRRVSFNPDVDIHTAMQRMKMNRVHDEIHEDENEAKIKDAIEIKDDKQPNGKTLDVEKSANGTGSENEDNVTIPVGPTSTTDISIKQKQGVIKSDASHSGASPGTNSAVTRNIIFDLSSKKKTQVHIQGPYGTPSTSIFHSEHAVLIGAGIGVTPFASIVQSVICRHRNMLNKCPSCEHTWVDEGRRKKALRVKKVDFVWLNRNHTSFEWFVDMLLNLENEQSHYSLDRFLDIHLFMTGMQRFDLKNFGLQMALDLVHEQENRDILTGLRTKLQAGRPNWEKLFQQIKDENKGKVSVFFCGAPALGSVIRKYCDQFGFGFHKESF